MPCLCQYFATELGLRVDDSLNVIDSNNQGASKEVSTSEVNASELAACKAEVLTLKNELSKAKISAENMETLMKIMIEKQNCLLTEVIELKKSNDNLRLQLVRDRNNQSLERGILLRELYEIKILLRERSNVVEKTLQENQALNHALKEANEKIYTMGMKFLKLRHNRRPSRDDDGNQEREHGHDANDSDEATITDGSISMYSSNLNLGP